MNQYVTGAMIKRLRENKRLTQRQLAERVNVSEKAVSRWETGRGYPDITLLEPLAAALGVSVIELLSGEDVVNTNRAFHMPRMKFYVCPICGNVILSAGEALVSCCGITLPALESEPADGEHAVQIAQVEDEYYVCMAHEMSRTHAISFIAALRDDVCEIKKLYPEGAAEARFQIGGLQGMYVYCNRHGLFRVDRKALRESRGEKN